MITRIKTAYSKLAFGYRTASGTADFFRLLINSKKYSRSRVAKRRDPPVLYRLKPGGPEKNVWLRTYSGDIEMLYEIFWRNVYSNNQIRWNQLTNIVDLGANIGMTSLFFAQKTQATIYAVEPDPDNFEQLTHNLADEISASRLVPVQAAIAAEDKPLFLHKNQKSYNSTVSGTTESDIVVRGMTIKTLFREMYLEQVDLLKIDIEGGEEDLFSVELDWLEMVNNIVMECHSEKIRQFATDQLTNNGFVVSTGNNGSSYANILWACR